MDIGGHLVDIGGRQWTFVAISWTFVDIRGWWDMGVAVEAGMATSVLESLCGSFLGIDEDDRAIAVAYTIFGVDIGNNSVSTDGEQLPIPLALQYACEEHVIHLCSNGPQRRPVYAFHLLPRRHLVFEPKLGHKFVATGVQDCMTEQLE